ncbi:ABC transporter ATP-binding protein [Massilia aurea]|uniref:ABC transporter ATP-binding protein n=1 Tax=Massilia aurea TaxID=373040 RepID=UPI003461BE06
MTPSPIQMRGVAKHFGSKAILDNLDWEVRPGQVIGLLGRNGAGKSTLMECLLGLREIDGGSVTLFGEPLNALTDATRARIGYVPQKSGLFEWMTALQMLDYFKAMYPRWNDAKVDLLLDRWGFDGLMRNKPIRRLSGGEQQRLSIIRALAHDPDLLVLDEPASALDPAGRRSFLAELVDGVIEQGTTVVFSTHILTDLERVAPDVAFLKDGRIALQGELDTLLDGARRVIGPASLLGAALPGELRRSQAGDGSVCVIVQGGAPPAAAPGVRIEPLGLEDLFIEVTR